MIKKFLSQIEIENLDEFAIVGPKLRTVKDFARLFSYTAQ